jgi:Tn3 transposase DDE domain
MRDRALIENWNGATAFIFYGHEGDFQTNRLDEQELVALSLHLLQICLIYINTLLVQRVLAEPKHFQAMQPADWRGLTPLFYQHVNPYGIFRLDMNERMQIDGEEATAS